MKFDEFVDELSESETALTAHHETGLCFGHAHPAAGTRPGTSHPERKRSGSWRPPPINEAIGQATFKRFRESHVTPFAGEFTIRPPPEAVTTLRAVQGILSVRITTWRSAANNGGSAATEVFVRLQRPVRPCSGTNIRSPGTSIVFAARSRPGVHAPSLDSADPIPEPRAHTTRGEASHAPSPRR
jgi:hypothetical protein